VAEFRRPNWDEYFLALANAVAIRGDCRRDQVGAVIVSPDHRQVAAGYNGPPAGGPSCLAGACPRCLKPLEELPHGSGYEECICIHAEMNAVIYAGRDRCLGGTIYISRKPCFMCTLIIRAAGIHRAAWGPAFDSGEEWY